MTISAPATINVRQFQGDTIPVVIGPFAASVDGAQFTMVHSLFGTLTAVGDGTSVSFPIDETKAAAELGRYTYYLVINEGVEGSEQVVCRGAWSVEQRATDLVTIRGHAVSVYGTFAAADAYLTTSDRFARAWDVLSDEDKARKLVEVARNFNKRPWKGEKTSPSQALAWPRTGASDPDGNDIDSSETPDDIVEASYMLAGILTVRPNALGTGTAQPAVQSLREGPVSVSFFGTGSSGVDASGTPIVDEIEAMLVGYLGTTGGVSYGAMLAGLASGTDDGESEFTDDKRYTIQDGLS